MKNKHKTRQPVESTGAADTSSATGATASATEPDEANGFRVEDGRAQIRSNIVRTRRSTVLVENAPLGFRKLAALATQRTPALAVLAIVALISFFIGRFTASGAYAHQPSPADETATAAVQTSAVADSDSETATAVAADIAVQSSSDAVENPQDATADPLPSLVATPSASTSDVAVSTPVSAIPLSGTVIAAELNGIETGAPAGGLDAAAENARHTPGRTGQYAIQVRAYRAGDDAVADILIARLRQRGVSPVYKLADRQQRIRVCVGAFNSRNDAQLSALLVIINGMLDRSADGVIQL